MSSLDSKLSSANENTWMRLGVLSEAMHDPDKALYSYENALRHNRYNLKAITQIASIYRLREQYSKAVEYFQRFLDIETNNGEIWGALGHCYLMMPDLQKAYTAYQQALYHLPNPKDPNLWYGIGILYDRYGSFEHAEEAFTAVLKMDSKFEKSNEIYFRLGIIYKQQAKYDQSLECFRFILQKPPRPLGQGDIWFQIGTVYELQKDFTAAKEAYEKVLKETPNHAKALQQLGWLYHSNPSTGNQEIAINYLMRSIDAEQTDGQTWYLLGRCYMAQQQYKKAYDAYQQAVYRDGRNPTFWCSIGVLYYQINQYRDALDAYSRAIRLNPYLSEVWYDLGTLYESCGQIQDSLDAYRRAADMDPGNKHIQQRLSALIASQSMRGDEPRETNDKVPRTLEPRAAHVSGDPPSRMTPGSIPAVPDLVDLSDEGDKHRTLPSTNEMNTIDEKQRDSRSQIAPQKFNGPPLTQQEKPLAKSQEPPKPFEPVKTVEKPVHVEVKPPEEKKAEPTKLSVESIVSDSKDKDKEKDKEKDEEEGMVIADEPESPKSPEEPSKKEVEETKKTPPPPEETSEKKESAPVEEKREPSPKPEVPEAPKSAKVTPEREIETEKPASESTTVANNEELSGNKRERDSEGESEEGEKRRKVD